MAPNLRYCSWLGEEGRSTMLPKSLEAELVKGNKYLRSVLTEEAQSVRVRRTTSVRCIDGQPVEKERSMQPL